MVYGSVCTKFEVCIVFRFARRCDTHKYTPIQVKIGISSTGCSPHGDFETWKKFLVLENFEKFLISLRRDGLKYCSPVEFNVRKLHMLTCLNFRHSPLYRVCINTTITQKVMNWFLNGLDDFKGEVCRCKIVKSD